MSANNEFQSNAFESNDEDMLKLATEAQISIGTK